MAFETNLYCMIPGARSRGGSPIVYMRVGDLVPSDWGKNYVKMITDWQIWWSSVGTFLEGMDFHRNGVLMIMDMKGLGWKNFDMGLQKKMNATIMENFPQRIDKILCINPPAIFSAIMAISRFMVKKKMMDKIQICEPEVLLDYVDNDNLWSEFGGNIEYDGNTLIQTITNRLEISPIHHHTLAKKQNGSRKNTPKVTKKKKNNKIPENLDGINIEDIPVEIIEEIRKEDNEDADEDLNEEEILDVSDEHLN